MSSAYAQLESRISALLKSGAMAEPDFNACALEVYRFQREHNLPYDNYCKRLGASVDLQNWKQIPAVPQSAFKQSALRAFVADRTAKTFRTSGTTGEGYGSHHFCSLRLYDEAILSGWDFFDLPVLPQIILVPSPAAAPHSSLSHMMGVMKARALYGEQYFCNTETIDGLHASFAAAVQLDRPVLVMGTALAFLHLFEKGGLPKLPAGSFALETGGYKGSGRSLTKAELYALFAKHFGLPHDSVINEYGMTELSSQFYTRDLGNPHKGPPWMRALVIDPETDAEVAIGETGILRIFDLANLGSVIAVQTQDLAIRREAGFELIGRDPAALPRGCSRSADEMLSRPATQP
jgi:hypothetical protein